MNNPARVSNNANRYAEGLSYRPPFDWDGLLHFLAARALKGVERIEAGHYVRTVRIDGRTGWIDVENRPEELQLGLTMSDAIVAVRDAVVQRLEHLFDLTAHPDVVTAHLKQDPILADIVTSNPGLRVPGAFDGFEMAVRAILGQQITVGAATTLGGRFSHAFGEEIQTPYPGVDRLCPTPETVASLEIESLVELGIVRARARTIITMAENIAAGKLTLEPSTDPQEGIRQLVALPGIGPWTAHYIAMRTLRDPDAFPREDIGLRQVLGGVSAAQADSISQPWRPWRSYATIHLWNHRAANTRR